MNQKAHTGQLHSSLRSSSLPRKLRRNIEDYGWWSAIGKSVAYLHTPIWKRQVYRFYRIDLRTVSSPKDLAVDKFNFKILDASDECAIGQIEALAEWLEGKLEDKIANGDLCLTAFHNDLVTGFNLITFGEAFIPLIGLRRFFGQGKAWSEHIAVQKNFRKMGLASQLRYRIFDELRSQGISRLYGGALRTNIPSLMLAKKVGFRELVDVYYIKVLGFEAWRYERVRE